MINAFNLSYVEREIENTPSTLSLLMLSCCVVASTVPRYVDPTWGHGTQHRVVSHGSRFLKNRSVGVSY